MRSLSLLVLLAFFSTNAQADAFGVVVNAARKLRLSNHDAVPLKDYSLNVGTRQGVMVGDVLAVHRPFAVRNGHSDASIHLISIPLGYLKVVAVGENVSLAQVEGTINAPLASLQYPGVMIGDEVLPKTFAKTDLPSAPPIP